MRNNKKSSMWSGRIRAGVWEKNCVNVSYKNQQHSFSPQQLWCIGVWIIFYPHHEKNH